MNDVAEASTAWTGGDVKTSAEKQIPEQASLRSLTSVTSGMTAAVKPHRSGGRVKLRRIEPQRRAVPWVNVHKATQCTGRKTVVATGVLK